MKEPTKPRVLYLEDDEDTREMVTFILGQSDIEVATATVVDEAWQMATAQTFDLYLLDGLLPHGNSLGLCRNLHIYDPFTPILFYSAMAFEADIKKGMDAGAAGYLTKPFSGDLSETIRDTIRKALKNVPPGAQM